MKTGFYRQGKQIIEWSKEDGSKLEAYVEHHPLEQRCQASLPRAAEAGHPFPPAGGRTMSTQELSPDVNLLAGTATIHRGELKKWERNIRLYAESHANFLRNFEPMLCELEDLEVEFTFPYDVEHQRLCFSGDKQKLLTVWRVLRRHGFSTEKHPEEGSPTFCTWFKHENGATIFFWFSSTQCIRKQVGTKLVETPIYETVCTEQLEQSSGKELV